MSLADVFAPAEDAYRTQVMHDTWGHMAPTQQVKHPGSFVFVWAGYGGAIEILTANFPTLDDSPWFFEHMQDFAGKHIHNAKHGIFKFEGTYLMFKNGNCRFSGKVRYIDPDKL